MKKLLAIIAVVAVTSLSGQAIAADSASVQATAADPALAPATVADPAPKPVDYMPTLITATPLEGRMLAMTIVRKTIGTIQRDGEAKQRIRKIYAEDPMMLMRAVELVNLEFKIIAEANNYWKK